MYYERWPDVDESPEMMPEDVWPEGDPDELAVAFQIFLDELKAGFEKTKAALAPFIRARVVHARGYGMHELVEEFGKGYVAYPGFVDEITWANAASFGGLRVDRFEPYTFSSLDYKTLPNGRLMPIIKRGTGPSKDRFKNGGARDTVGKKATRERTYPTRR